MNLPQPSLNFPIVPFHKVGMLKIGCCSPPENLNNAQSWLDSSLPGSSLHLKGVYFKEGAGVGGLVGKIGSIFTFVIFACL